MNLKNVNSKLFFVSYIYIEKNFIMKVKHKAQPRMANEKKLSLERFRRSVSVQKKETPVTVISLSDNRSRKAANPKQDTNKMTPMQEVLTEEIMKYAEEMEPVVKAAIEGEKKVTENIITETQETTTTTPKKRRTKKTNTEVVEENKEENKEEDVQ